MSKIIILNLGLLTILLTLSGCLLTDKLAEKTTKKAVERTLEATTNAEVDINKEELNIKGENGENITVGKSLSLPADFPKDVPIYKNADITSASSDAVKQSYYLSLVSADSYQNIVDYYTNQLSKDGWAVNNVSQFTAEFTGGGQTTTYICSKDDRNLNVGVQEVDDKINITILVTKKVE